MYASMHAHTHAHTHACTHARTHVCVCMHACMYLKREGTEECDGEAEVHDGEHDGEHEEVGHGVAKRAEELVHAWHILEVLECFKVGDERTHRLEVGLLLEQTLGQDIDDGSCMDNG